MEKVFVAEEEARIRNIVPDYFSARGLRCDLARNGGVCFRISIPENGVI